MEEMEVREATPADVDAICALLDAPTRATERLLAERSVVVGEADIEANASAAEDDRKIVGVCAFDYWDDAVQVTRLASETGAVDALLAPALERAAAAGVPVEVLVVDGGLVEALRAAGFEETEGGPRFEGRVTRVFRQEP